MPTNTPIPDAAAAHGATTPPGADVWNDALLQNPHVVADKRRRVQEMFAAIAPSYDLNNRLHSLWMDQSWRTRAVRLARLKPTDVVVDVACGTGDLTLKFASALHRLSPECPAPGQVVGIDFTYQMLPIARSKAAAFGKALSLGKSPASAESSDGGTAPAQSHRADAVHAAPAQSTGHALIFACGDATRLSLPDACADVVSIAFGIRNVNNPAVAVREFFRVLKPLGRLVILEFSLPTNPVLRAMYNLYFRQVLPRTATLISGDKTGAYKYLPQSVNTFISRETMMQMMTDAGFQDVRQTPMTFGVSVCYVGTKNA